MILPGKRRGKDDPSGKFYLIMGHMSDSPTLSFSDIRRQFPILDKQIHGKPLVYFDNSATTQKPNSVLEAITEYYTKYNANIHRGVHQLAEESTDIWEKSRQTVASFFRAHPEELIVTRNTTEALNLLARGWGESQVKPGEVILVGLSEHHSNYVPWQKLADRQQAKFMTLPIASEGLLDLPAIFALLKEHKNQLRVISIQQASNTLGSLMDISAVSQMLKDLKIRDQVLLSVDAAQSAAHQPINFKTWDVDAVSFSGHKMYGPMGIGGLLIKNKRLAEFEPVLYGGGMISTVLPEETTYAEDVQDRFTAGTPDVASLYGLAAACDFLKEIGWPAILAHEEELTQYALDQLKKLPEITIVGPQNMRDEAGKQQRIGAISFLYQQVHAHDVAQILDRHGVAVRSGQHCTMPLHVSQGWLATTRASFGVYNTKSEVDTLISALKDVKRVFGRQVKN